MIEPGWLTDPDVTGTLFRRPVAPVFIESEPNSPLPLRSGVAKELLAAKSASGFAPLDIGEPALLKSWHAAFEKFVQMYR